MELSQLRRILEEMEQGMSLTVAKDWTTSNVEGEDETQRDLNTIELATSNDCTWERDPEGHMLTFSKQAPTDR